MAMLSLTFAVLFVALYHIGCGQVPVGNMQTRTCIVFSIREHYSNISFGQLNAVSLQSNAEISWLLLS